MKFFILFLMFTYNVDKSWYIGPEFFDSMEIGHFLVSDDERFYRVFLVVIRRRRQIKYFSFTALTGLVCKVKKSSKKI